MDKNNSDPSQASNWVNEHLAALNIGEDWRPNAVSGLERLRQLQNLRPWVSRSWLLAITTAVAVCLCLVFLPSPKVLAHRCLECSIAVWKAISPTASVDTKLKPEDSRSVAPDFILQDANSEDVKLSALKGKVVLLNFWATWCEGCQVEIPWFMDFEKRYQSQGFVVIGVSMDSDGWKSVKPWLKEKKVNYPIVIGNDELGKQYGLDAMPLSVLVDRHGRIADVHSGLVNKLETQEKIRALLQDSRKKSPN